MTQGFYEQIGIDPSASSGDVRTAYTRAVAQLMRRRKALVEQGGDTTPLDLARSQLDEAWEVLADPVRRRRYDAMRAVSGEISGADPADIWERVSGSLVHPAAGAAADLLRVTTTLKVGLLPRPPSPPRALLPEDEPTLVDTPPRVRPVAEERAGDVVPLPTAAPTPPEPKLRVVDGSPEAPSVLVLPQASPRSRAVSSEDVARLVDRHGYSGQLLKAVREARGLALQEVSDTTRISVRYLEAIERDEYQGLPSATFVRGYVREVARLLSLHEDDVVSGYMRRFSGDA